MSDIVSKWTPERLKAIGRYARTPHFPWKIYVRSVIVQVVLVVIALASSGFAARHFFKRQFLDQVQSQVESNLRFLSHDFPANPPTSWCASHSKDGDYQLTLFHLDGNPFCDSHTPVSEMANAIDAKEVKRALTNPLGFSVVKSDTMKTLVFYGAIRTGNWIIRTAVPLSRLTRTLQVLDTSLALFLFGLATFLMGISLWTSQRLFFPMARLLGKTKALLKSEKEPTVTEEFEEKGFDEWLELESDIEHLRRNLRKNAETINREQVELETIMASISDAILAVDPEGNPLFFNTRFEILFGQQGQLRRSVNLWGIFRDPEILGAFTAALKEGKAVTTNVISIEEISGAKYYFSLSASPLRRESGEVYGAVGIFHDITVLKSAEQMRIDFVANVSHELRTPLTSIKGYVDTLQADAESGKPLSKEFLPIISRNCERLMNLMKDLLDISSLESGDSIRKEWVDTEEITSRILGQFSEKISNKQQKVETKIGAPSVFGDYHRLEQVLVNLIDNATKYASAGATIEVEWSQDEEDVVLRISNEGPAIPPEHHNRLFERFYRVDKARSREQGGTGLGLAIVKHIMQRHDGSVKVESAVGKGTSFFCRFPGSSV